MTEPQREPDRCSAPYRVRFDEAAPDGLVRTSVLLRYAQDLAWHHSALHGYDRAWYGERGLAWLARAAEVGVLGPMRVGDALVGTTQVIGWRRVWARRRTDFVDAPGGRWRGPMSIGSCSTAAAPRRACRASWSVASSPPPRRSRSAGSRLGTPPASAHRATWRVRPQELDPMDHVNNAVYADWLDEQISAAGGSDSSLRSRARSASSTPGRWKLARRSMARSGATTRAGRADSSTLAAARPSAAGSRRQRPARRDAIHGCRRRRHRRWRGHRWRGRGAPARGSRVHGASHPHRARSDLSPSLVGPLGGLDPPAVLDPGEHPAVAGVLRVAARRRRRRAARGRLSLPGDGRRRPRPRGQPCGPDRRGRGRRVAHAGGPGGAVPVDVGRRGGRSRRSVVRARAGSTATRSSRRSPAGARLGAELLTAEAAASRSRTAGSSRSASPTGRRVPAARW